MRYPRRWLLHSEKRCADEPWAHDLYVATVLLGSCQLGHWINPNDVFVFSCHRLYHKAQKGWCHTAIWRQALNFTSAIFDTFCFIDFIDHEQNSILRMLRNYKIVSLIVAFSFLCKFLITHFFLRSDFGRATPNSVIGDVAMLHESVTTIAVMGWVPPAERTGTGTPI